MYMIVYIYTYIYYTYIHACTIIYIFTYRTFIDAHYKYFVYLYIYIYIDIYIYIIEGSLEVKLPSDSMIWTDEKQRWEESAKRRERRKKIKKEKVSEERRSMPVREKVGKSRNTVFFQWFGAPEGRKVGSLKRRVRSQLARWEMKNCTPLWREAHLQVKKLKTPHGRSTFRSWDVEKVHAVVARSAFASEKGKSTRTFGTLFEVVEKVHAVVARSTFRSQNVKSSTCSGHFWTFRCAFPKTMAGVGHLKRICNGRRSTRDMFIRAVRRSGRWFPERGCILEHQIFRFAEMILRDRCSTSYDPVSLFRGRRSNLDRWSGKIAKRIGTGPSALHSTFHFWRTSLRIASFLMLST